MIRIDCNGEIAVYNSIAELVDDMSNCLEDSDINTNNYEQYLDSFKKSYPKWIAYGLELSNDSY